MTFNEYHLQHQHIIDATNPAPPYDNPDYFNYAKLNLSRTNRWLKTAVITDNNKDILKNITQPQKWILITEPWCGDASHIVPIIHLLSEQNSNIQLDIELRDQEPHRINQYLTNGGKAIPMLIIKDANDNDIAVWGPRPAACQAYFNEMKAANADFETLKTNLQNWYNENKSLDIQNEICALLK